MSIPDEVFRIDVAKHRDRVDRAIDEQELDSLKAIWEPVGLSFDAGVSERLQEFALSESWPVEKLDGWLAPRVHNLLRFPRRTASDPGVWCWFATTVFRPYMRKRWPKKAESGWWRYQSGDILRNGVSRLWWAAEMVRNGPDYSLVPSALAEVRTFQNVSELRYSWHRETARAFARVLADVDDNGDRLSVVLNAYLATQSLEAFDTEFDLKQSVSWDHTWAKKSPSFKQLLAETEELEGPDAGYTREDVENRIYEWLIELYEAIEG